MNTNGANILDILPGLPQPSGNINTTGTVSGKTALFDEMIDGLLLSSQPKQDISVNSQQSNEDSNLLLVNTLLNSNPLIEMNQPEQIAKSIKNGIKADTEPPQIAVPLVLPDIVPDNIDTKQTLTQITDNNNEKSATNTLLQFPDHAIPLNEFVQNIIDGNNIKIPTGRYHINGWQIQGNMLNLDVSPSDQGGSSLRVSLPVKQLLLSTANQQTMSNTAFNGQQTELIGQERALLEDYLSKLNIKELIINQDQKISTTPATSLPDDKVGVEIVALNAGQVVSLKTRMAQSDINARNIDIIPQKILSAEPVGFGNNLTDTDSTNILNSINQKNDWSHQADLWSFDSKNKAQAKIDIGSNDLSTIGHQLQTNNTTTTINGRVVFAPVRFTLPDNLSSFLRPNGNSIQLHIEPKHLGPARLKLTMHRDSLRAVVTVETSQAKMAVENSLEQLRNSLSQVGIRVDYIDVNVDPRQSGNQLFEQHLPANKTRSSHLSASNKIDTDQSETVMTRYYPAASFIGANGVNVLA